MKRPCPEAHQSTGTQPIAPKRRKDEKIQVTRVNRRLQELGQRKQSVRALELFEANFGAVGGSGPLRPSIHSFTNLVNAYVRVGNVDLAKNVVASMKARGFEPNVVTHTTVLKGLCEQGYMKEAARLEASIEGNERSLSTFLRGCLRWGAIDCALRRWKQMTDCDAVSREYLVKIFCNALRVKTARQVLAVSGEASMACNLALAEAELLLGHRKKCRALLSKKVPDDMDSTHAFVQHKMRENERNRQRLWKSTSPRDLQSCFRRFLYFRSDSLALAREMRGIGLRKSRVDEEARRMPNVTPLRLETLDPRPLKLEIGAGDGEWVVQHAPQDASSLWAALELRYDRCARIWSQMCLQSIDNILILGGDAHYVVGLLPADSVVEVVSFYPEPPAWHEGAWDADTPHLWTQQFLTTLGEKMQTSGELRICSDNKKYLELIKSYCPPTFAGAQSLAIEVESGRIDDSDTYFDRLWRRGKKSKRFNLCLRRI